MNKIQQLFNYQGSQIRTFIKDGEPWFVAKDVCAVLEIGNTSMALERLEDDEKGISSIETLGGRQDLVTVNEPGLYSLILGSRKPEAKSFKRWITHEVIPSIRKTGSYGVNRLPQNYKEALIALIEEVDKTEKLQIQISDQAPKVALFDVAMQAQNAQPMNTVAKTLNIGRNKLFAILREKKILMRNNQPYQQYLDRGYFEVRQYTITHLTSGLENKPQTLVTPTGMAYIHQLLQKEAS